METNIINKSVNIQFPEDVLGIQFFGRWMIVVLSLSGFGELVRVHAWGDGDVFKVWEL